MLKKRNLIFICLLILGVFLITSCLPKPPVTEGILKGQVIVPEGSKQLTGQALANATINIIDPATGDIIATTTTDVNGYYQVFVPAGGPYLLEAVKDEVKVLQITPQVEVGIEYALGTADCNTTAVALIALAMMDAGANLADIDLADIEADPNFDDVIIAVFSAIEAGEDPAELAIVQQAVEDFLSPPAPAPTPIPTYTVTFDSQGGSSVSSQTVEHGGKATEPTNPTRTGYTFGGWYKESGCTNAWNFDTDTVISDATIYAKWTIDRYVSKSGNNGNDGSADHPWLTIQYALDTTPHLGTIIVKDDGLYDESIQFHVDRSVVLKNTTGFTPVIKGDSDNPTVTFSGYTTYTSTMEGFTITHTSGEDGRGIHIEGGSRVNIVNCTISDNTTSDGAGGILLYSGYNIVMLTDCTIENNTASYAGGIGIYNASHDGVANNELTLNHCSITGNEANATDGKGGGIYIDGAVIDINECTISGNHADYQYSAGVYLYRNISGYPPFEDNTICGNYITGNPPTLGDQIGNGISSLDKSNYNNVLNDICVDCSCGSATLSALSLSTGILAPTFDCETISYTATVANSIESITVTPTANCSGATITVNDVAVESGSASNTISLDVGENTITIVVKATKTYTVTVTRTAIPITAIDATTGTAKVGVELTAGALTPAGATATYQWQICTTVDGTYEDIGGATSTTYTPVADDLTKFIKVVATGTGSYSGTVTSTATAAVANGEQAAPTGLTGVAPTTYGGTDGKITGTTTAMEYKLSTEPTTWTPATVTEITDLAVGTYHVRYAAKAGFNAGTAADVVVPALAIGHSYGGGIVAYILQIGDLGYDANVQHGLIAATADQSTSCAWSNITTILIGTTGTSIGAGLANTTAIIGQSGHTNSAAKVCDDYSVTVSSVIYDDWFLPSRDELYQLYINQDEIGGFAINDYWSSSESPYANHAWFQYFEGTKDFTNKYRLYRVRAVRAF